MQKLHYLIKNMANRKHSALEEEEKEDLEYSDSSLLPFLDYLHSKRGHELANRLLDVIEDFKKASLDKNTKAAITQFKWVTVIQVGTVVLAISAATYLTIHDKFTTTISLFLGTIIGYFFGKKAN